jgi:chemotaxis protein histidine kinase CheA
MEDFQQQFSLDAVKNLKNLQKKLQSAESFSDSERRKVFRTLHTIKGTAQTLGFSAASRLAHELKNVLSAERFVVSENFQSLFRRNRLINKLF